MKYKFLYRALRPIEIERGNQLIPKVSGPDEFASEPMFGIDTTFPITFGGVDNKVRQHQWMQKGLDTSGLSFTPFLERAKFYAKRNKIIVKIDTSNFQELGIKPFDVNEILKHKPNDIAVPEDNEMILTYEKGGEFPKEIIHEIILLED